MRRHAIGKLWLVAMAAVTLAACARTTDPQPQALPDGLETLVVPVHAPVTGRTWDGVVEAVQQATLIAQTSGRVEDVLHDVNDRVEAGQVLLRLSAVEQRAGVDAARAQLRAADAAAMESEANLERFRELARDRFVSRAQLDQMQANRDAAVAGRDAARAQLSSLGKQVDYTTIRAPYAGVIARREVEPGESVGVGQSLMSIFSPGALRIEVSIPQSDAQLVRTSEAGWIELDDGRTVQARSVTVFPVAEPTSHAVRVRLDLPGLDPAPHPGTTAKVAFPALPDAGWPRIPASALRQRGEVNAVYVVDGDRLALRQVRVGSQAGADVDVISGLRTGETIALDPVAAAQAVAAARTNGD